MERNRLVIRVEDHHVVSTTKFRTIESRGIEQDNHWRPLRQGLFQVRPDVCRVNLTGPQTHRGSRVLQSAETRSVEMVTAAQFGGGLLAQRLAKIHRGHPERCRAARVIQLLCTERNIEQCRSPSICQASGPREQFGRAKMRPTISVRRPDMAPQRSLMPYSIANAVRGVNLLDQGDPVHMPLKPRERVGDHAVFHRYLSILEHHLRH